MIYEIRKPIPVPPNAPLDPPKSVAAPYRKMVGIEIVTTVTEELRAKAAVDLDGVIRSQLAQHAESLGHKVTDVRLRWTQKLPEDVRRRFPRLDPDAPPFAWYAVASAVADGFPQAYPMCGDWYCDDEYDWDAFDPLIEPAEFKWARIERQIIDSAPNESAALDMLQARRDSQANGMPLWTLAR